MKLNEIFLAGAVADFHLSMQIYTANCDEGISQLVSEDIHRIQVWSPNWCGITAFKFSSKTFLVPLIFGKDCDLNIPASGLSLFCFSLQIYHYINYIIVCQYS